MKLDKALKIISYIMTKHKARFRYAAFLSTFMFSIIIILSPNTAIASNSSIDIPLKKVAYPWVIRPDLFDIPINQNGSIIEPNVVGGNSYTPENKYPWIVSMQYFGHHYCGGALINPEWILTSAHCWTDYDGNQYEVTPNDTAVLGEYDFSIQSGNEQVLSLAEIHRHPSYNYVTFENDFALVKLNTPATINANVDTIQIVEEDPGDLDFQDSMILGWGHYYYQQPVSFNNLIHEAAIQILPDSWCANYGNTYDPISMMCGGMTDYSKDACQGDSGGPLAFEDAEGWKQAGVISWGYGCATDGYPGIYARVSSASTWISSLLGFLNGDIEIPSDPLYFSRGVGTSTTAEVKTINETVEDTVSTNHYDQLSQIIEIEGRARVILELEMGWQSNSILSADQVEQQKTHIADVQSLLLAEMSPFDVLVHATYDLFPFIAMEIDAAALNHLISSPLVKNIEEDKVVEISLDTSVPLIDADNAWAWGYTGADQTIAILDTGIRSDHIAFGGSTSRVVEEACFSGYTAEESLCPNGSNSQVGSGAADATTSNCYDGPSNICWHGTHVAGIIAGNHSTYSGVAPDVNIIAVQVFSRVVDGGQPTVSAYANDILSGLEHIYNLRNSYDIAAINLSLGSGYYNSSCDSEISSITTVVNDLKLAGIATIAASGNDTFTDGINWPACISNVVSVGSTTKADTIDKEESTSNIASFLDLLAPGTSIQSADVSSISDFKSASGTSMAAPHVTGAWAILANAHPKATVEDILNALKDTGRNIIDPREGGGVIKPRIDVDNAILWPADLQVSNLGPGYLEITDISATGASCWLDLSHKALPVNIPLEETFPVYLHIDESCVGPGIYSETIHIISNDPDEPDVYVSVQLEIADTTQPPATTLLEPPDESSSIDTTPTFSWSPAGDAIQYQIMVDNNADFTSLEIDQTVAVTQYTPSESLPHDLYYWKVRAGDSSDNWGEWSAVWKITVGAPPGPFNKTSPPNGAADQPTNPFLTWGVSSDATSYEYCIDTSDDNSCSTWTDNGTSNSVQVTGLSLDTTHFWHVRATNDFGTTYTDGAATAYWNFTTEEINDSTPPSGNFLTPITNGSVIKPRALLSLYATDDLSGVKSVTFSAYYNANWHTLWTDTDGSDGWKYQWPTYDILEQTIKVRAVIEDFAGNQSPEIIVSNISLSSTFIFGNGYETRSSSGGQSNSGIRSSNNWTATKNLNLDVYQNSGLIPTPRILMY